MTVTHPKPPQPTGVSLNKTTLSLEVTGTETLTATVEPADAEDKTVTWTSSDSTIATVDANGLVMAVKAGTATITVSTVNNIVDNCDLTVTVSSESASDSESVSDSESISDSDSETTLNSTSAQPNESWTKDDIKKYLDEKGTVYNTSATKAELLNLV
ncbi:MAG: Ig domain-containing protein [Lactococcus petauri]